MDYLIFSVTSTNLMIKFCRNASQIYCLLLHQNCFLQNSVSFIIIIFFFSLQFLLQNIFKTSVASDYEFIRLISILGIRDRQLCPAPSFTSSFFPLSFYSTREIQKSVHEKKQVYNSCKCKENVVQSYVCALQVK